MNCIQSKVQDLTLLVQNRNENLSEQREPRQANRQKTTPSEISSRFVEQIVPALTQFAKMRFAFLKREARQEMIQESLALGWARYVRLCERGRDPSPWSNRFAKWIARAVASGRRLAGQGKAKDAMRRERENFEEPHLRRTSSVWMQAHFRDALPRWFASLTPTNRRICQLLAEGENAKTVAQRLEVSPSLVTQVRKRLAANWSAFCES